MNFENNCCGSFNPYHAAIRAHYLKHILSTYCDNGFELEVESADDAYIVQAILPGVEKEDITVFFQGGRLTVEIKDDEETEQASVLLPLSREDGVKAALKNGILEITVPKVEGKQIQID